MSNSLRKLQDAHDFMIQAVANRPDGERYVPIVLRLEREIAERQDLRSDFERIRAMAANDSKRSAAT